MLNEAYENNEMVLFMDYWNLVKASANDEDLWTYLFSVHAFDPGYEYTQYGNKPEPKQLFLFQ